MLGNDITNLLEVVVVTESRGTFMLRYHFLKVELVYQCLLVLQRLLQVVFLFVHFPDLQILYLHLFHRLALVIHQFIHFFDPIILSTRVQ